MNREAEKIAQLLAAYGAGSERWPDRDLAARWNEDAMLRAQLVAEAGQAGEVDALLAEWSANSSAPPDTAFQQELLDRMQAAASGPAPKTDVSFSPVPAWPLPRWAAMAAALALVVSGVLSGYGMRQWMPGAQDETLALALLGETLNDHAWLEGEEG